MHHLEVPIILVVIGTFVVLLAAAFLLRQFLVSRTRGSFECTLRRRSLTGREAWQAGLMRYGTERLRWFRAFSMRLRPELTIRRAEIVDLERTPLESTVEGADPQVLLDVRLADGSAVRMILGRSEASGLLAWLEAAPAGSVVGGSD